MTRRLGTLMRREGTSAPIGASRAHVFLRALHSYRGKGAVSDRPRNGIVGVRQGCFVGKRRRLLGSYVVFSRARFDWVIG